MRDPRITALAKVLVHYSTGVKPGQLVRIAGDPVAMPLVEAVYEQVLKAGGHPLVRLSPGSCTDLFYEHANEEQLQYVNPLLLEEVKTIDAAIGFWADTNTKSLSRVDPKKQGLSSAARKPMTKIFFERAAAGDLKWAGTQYPTLASAQDAEMSIAQYEDFVFNAGHLLADDPVSVWQEISKRQQKVVDFLTGKKYLHFQTAAGTDLHVDVEGMTWINCDGHENFPDGEVFTGPNLSADNNSPAPGGVQGVVKYSFPAVHHGREVHDIELTFEKGRVVDAKASKGLDFLLAMLDQDPGARNMGEIAIGTNYQITEYSKNTLFDEKIGGTFHAAVGAGYPETGNANESGLHWDMVCDLREPGGGGTITVDGEVLSKNGKFVFDGWPGND
ncbi:aminopeptidase [Algisphaera agarilytica]|uniref:Aminopeptidase n=1 Tax=Algisphaera agarilytica TaxID=1385975 RepID=A0A7X0H725_9BACT|nr:aminopeptidase [Algisphaera agarilytica]MBB6430429.1 aminopeptidase [Algisphaera agarilytica]